MFFLIGLMGCGKSTIGKTVAKKCGFKFIDLDVYIEQNQNKTINDIFEMEGEEMFRNIELNLLQQIISNENERTIIACGGGTPCNKNAMDMMNACGTTIWLNATLKLIVNNLLQDKQNKRPLLNKIPKDNLIFKVEEILNQRLQFYSKAKYTINQVKMFEEDVLQIINHKING